jgi:uroporphyrinogen-III synthase
MLMTRLLHNKTILITRPEESAKSLAEDIQKEGGRSIILPMFKIINNDYDKLQSQLPHSESVDICIFTSQNAVMAIQNLDLTLFRRASVIAIGQGTAQALKKVGIPVHHIPKEQSSEGLLKLPILWHIFERNILIFCGENPRPLLQKKLVQGQAKVTEIFCYRREPLMYDSTTLKNALERSLYVVCTSLEGLTHFLSMLSQSSLLVLLRQRQLIVISEKMAAFAKRHRLSTNKATNASDMAILQVLFESVIPALKK